MLHYVSPCALESETCEALGSEQGECVSVLKRRWTPRVSLGLCVARIDSWAGLLSVRSLTSRDIVASWISVGFPVIWTAFMFALVGISFWMSPMRHGEFIQQLAGGTGHRPTVLAFVGQGMRWFNICQHQQLSVWLGAVEWRRAKRSNLCDLSQRMLTQFYRTKWDLRVDLQSRGCASLFHFHPFNSLRSLWSFASKQQWLIRKKKCVFLKKNKRYDSDYAIHISFVSSEEIKITPFSQKSPVFFPVRL